MGARGHGPVKAPRFFPWKAVNAWFLGLGTGAVDTAPICVTPAALRHGRNLATLTSPLGKTSWFSNLNPTFYYHVTIQIIENIRVLTTGG